MKYETPPRPQREPADLNEQRRARLASSEDAQKLRNDPRCELIAHAFVTVPSLPPRVYTLQEISRGGMFLRFRDSSTTRSELEQNGVESGTDVDVAFSVSSGEEKYRFDVRASIVRITRQGIALKFMTHNPPQLAALRELFARAGANAAADNEKIQQEN